MQERFQIDCRDSNGATSDTRGLRILDAGNQIIAFGQLGPSGTYDEAANLVDAANEQSKLLRLLKTALPYVQKVAATAPTEASRLMRQRQAVRDVADITAAIARAEGR